MELRDVSVQHFNQYAMGLPTKEMAANGFIFLFINLFFKHINLRGLFYAQNVQEDSSCALIHPKPGE